MITVFREDGKPLFEIASDTEATTIYAKKSFDPLKAVCANCGAIGFLTFYCGYSRWLTVLKDGEPNYKELKLDRHKCAICAKTHVVAAGEVVIPYMRHSLGFIVAAIEAYAKRVRPIRVIADHLQIAVSTLYEWVKRFGSHYELLMGKMAAVGDIRKRLYFRDICHQGEVSKTKLHADPSASA